MIRTPPADSPSEQPVETTTSDFNEILAALTGAAEQGNAEAQLRLGLLYTQGDDVQLDYVRGAQWISCAAEQGSADAMRYLAWLYAGGYGVEQDEAQTRHWYLAAANAGDIRAMTIVAHMYQTGKFGCTVDTSEMLRWYQSAAEQGDANAQYALGRLLVEGKRVKQNDEAAFQWLTLAIMSGSEPAKKQLAELTARLDSSTLERYKQGMMQAMMGQLEQ